MLQGLGSRWRGDLNLRLGYVEGRCGYTGDVEFRVWV